MVGPKKEKPSRKSIGGEGLKDLATLGQECARPESIGPEGYRSVVVQNLSLIHIGCCIPEDYELELPGPDSWINNPPSGRLGVYEVAFEEGLRFPLPSFILELLRSYGIPLYVLILNSIRHIVGFLDIYFLAKISLSFLVPFFLHRLEIPFYQDMVVPCHSEGD